MPPRRRIDHHNSRIYRGASAPPVAPGPVLTIVWLFDAAKRAFARLFGSDRATTSPKIVLRSASRHGYTVLGATILPRPVHHSLPANDLSDR